MQFVYNEPLEVKCVKNERSKRLRKPRIPRSKANIMEWQRASVIGDSVGWMRIGRSPLSVISPPSAQNTKISKKKKTQGHTQCTFGSLPAFQHLRDEFHHWAPSCPSKQCQGWCTHTHIDERGPHCTCRVVVGGGFICSHTGMALHLRGSSTFTTHQ